MPDDIERIIGRIEGGFRALEQGQEKLWLKVTALEVRMPLDGFQCQLERAARENIEKEISELRGGIKVIRWIGGVLQAAILIALGYLGLRK